MAGTASLDDGRRGSIIIDHLHQHHPRVRPRRAGLRESAPGDHPRPRNALRRGGFLSCRYYCYLVFPRPQCLLILVSLEHPAPSSSSSILARAARRARCTATPVRFARLAVHHGTKAQARSNKGGGSKEEFAPWAKKAIRVFHCCEHAGKDGVLRELWLPSNVASHRIALASGMKRGS